MLAGTWTWKQFSSSPSSTSWWPGFSRSALAPRPDLAKRLAANSRGRSSLETDAGRYVGDAACTRCHATIAESFARHPMGRSLTPIDRFAPAGANPFRNQATFKEGGLTFKVESRDGRAIHGEVLEDNEHRVIAQNEQEVRYAVGSGQQGVSFLIERGDGYLFSSPLSWYPRERGWDLAPGFKKQNPHFERPIRAGCLYCHANQTELVEGTENHYRSPIFRGHSIGCERCHGPGEDHAREPMSRVGGQPNIVNPAGLEPHLREGVCQQCHLQAEVRILRAGRSWTDYRPGSPLHEYIDVYLREGHRLGNRFVGQVEQMYASRCFQGSQATLGCISCHDPHVQPAPAERDAFYRGRCLACHASDGPQGSVAATIQAEASPR